MGGLWRALQQCDGSRTSLLAHSAAEGDCTFVPIHIPIDAGAPDASRGLAKHEAMLSVYEYAAYGGVVGSWVQPHGCATGYTAVLCGSCAAGYSREGSGQACVRCSSPLVAALRQLGVTTLVSAVTAGILYRTLTTNPVASYTGAAVRIGMDHIQVISVLSIINIDWGGALETTLTVGSWIAGAKVTIANLECVVDGGANGGDKSRPAAVYQAAVGFTFPILFIMVLAACWAGWWRFRHRARRRTRSDTGDSSFGNESDLADAESNHVNTRNTLSDPQTSCYSPACSLR